MPRINLTDKLFDAIVNLSDGNPGALHVLLEATTRAPSIDPASAFGSFTPILSLDTLEIYGSKIWILYKDCCQGDAVNLLAVLRAVQLGFYTQSELLNCVQNSTPIDCQTLRTKVREFLKEGEF